MVLDDKENVVDVSRGKESPRVLLDSALQDGFQLRVLHIFERDLVGPTQSLLPVRGSLLVIMKQRRPAHQFLVRLGIRLRKLHHAIDERVRAEAVDEETLIPRLRMVKVEAASVQNLKSTFPCQARMFSVCHANPI